MNVMNKNQREVGEMLSLKRVFMSAADLEGMRDVSLDLGGHGRSLTA
jgi:hypothetical protein